MAATQFVMRKQKEINAREDRRPSGRTAATWAPGLLIDAEHERANTLGTNIHANSLPKRRDGGRATTKSESKDEKSRDYSESVDENQKNRKTKGPLRFVR